MTKFFIKSITILGFVSFLLLHQSCERSMVDDTNPFENNTNNQDTVNFTIVDIDPNSIAGIYQNVFGPTCANSGCHDGTFEPDFRTIESSYHSLVYKTPIKNDGTLNYRVDPGNPSSSAIMKRLKGEIVPEMPIEIEPDSDWWEKSDEYIQNIENWIANGALDMAGNEPQKDYIVPSLLGVGAMAEGVWLIRENGYGPLLIPDSLSTVELYFGFDPINNPQDFTINELHVGVGQFEFTSYTTTELEIMGSPMINYGLYGTPIEYTHMVEVDLNELELNDGQFHMRVQVQDGSNPITELPSENGFYYVKEYMSFIRTN